MKELVENIEKQITTDKEDFRLKMPKQISSSVYWVQTIQLMLNEGVDTFIELGNGKVLAGLNRKICPPETPCLFLRRPLSNHKALQA